MKLILTQDVAGLGAPGDVVEVKDGYGRNFLLPRGFAINWTRGGETQEEFDKDSMRPYLAVIGMDFEKGVLRPVPLVQYLVDHIFVAVHTKAYWPFVRRPPGVAIHFQFHLLHSDA